MSLLAAATVPLGAIELDALGETIVAATVAGLGVTFAFALTILGFVRLAEANREGRTLEAVLAGALGVIASAAWIVAIVFGVIVMAS